MGIRVNNRRHFLKSAGLGVGACLLTSGKALASSATFSLRNSLAELTGDADAADYTLHIRSAPIEIAPKHIVSAITYNGQFPGPLLRFKEGRQAIVDVFNDTDTP